MRDEQKRDEEKKTPLQHAEGAWPDEDRPHVGAVPVQSSLPEAYTSMQTGVYDGWIMFPSGVVNFKLYEVSKYYTLDEHMRIPDLLVMSTTAVTDLPASAASISARMTGDWLPAR